MYKRHVMLNLTSTRVCNSGTSAQVVCVKLASLINMVVDVVVQNPQKSNEYEYEKKKHVRRDSKMCCCCCCRFCCGAPTTGERMHAPVLHVASQIAYCRYWGCASVPPITSISVKIQGVRTGRQESNSQNTQFCKLRIYRFWCWWRDPPKIDIFFCAGFRLHYCRYRSRLLGFFCSATIIIAIVIVVVIVIEVILALHTETFLVSTSNTN